MRTVLGISLCAVVLFTTAPRALPQTTQQPPTFRDRVDVVRLDVAVVDKGGHPVRGLTAEDFTVFEDGKPARVVGLSAVELPPPTPPTTPWLRDVAPDVVTNDVDARRLIIILFDDAYSGFNFSKTSGVFRDPWILGAGKTIARSVIDGLGPNDLAAVTYTYMGRRQNFTSDRAKLLASVNTFLPQGGSAAGPPLGCQFKGVVGCVLDAFQQIVTALPTNPPMRKAIVFISQNAGLPTFSAEALARYDNSKENPGTSSQLITDLGGLFRRLQEANTSIYAFSPGGLQIVNSGANDSLRMLAENTGGRAIVDTNKPWKGVPSVLEETSAYYVLGVQTLNHDGRFHRVRVQVNRQGVDVRTRIGYITPGPASTTTTVTSSGGVARVDRALSAGFPTAELPMTTTAAAFAVPGTTRARVSIATGIRTAPGDADPLPVELIALAYDKEWKPSPAHRQTVLLQGGPGAYADVRSRLDLEPGRYELRIGGTAGDRVGSVFVDLEIPQFDHAQFVASGLVLTTSPPARAASGALDLESLQPTARRTFARDERVTAIQQFYERGAASLRPVAIETTIVDETGRTVFTKSTSLGAADFDSARVATHVFALPLTQLAAGEYLVTVAATEGERRSASNVRVRVGG